MKYHVKQLDLFGSADTDCFDESISDIDFILQFHHLTPAEHARSYFGLLAELQDLFKREIDLIEYDAVSNPFFLQSVERTRSVIYAA